MPQLPLNYSVRDPVRLACFFVSVPVLSNGKSHLTADGKSRRYYANDLVLLVAEIPLLSYTIHVMRMPGDKSFMRESMARNAYPLHFSCG